MGCKYACVCGANCLRCSQYEPEEYFGHAEDMLAQTKGFASDDEWRRHKREEEKKFTMEYNMPTPEVTGSAASQSEEIKKIAREYAKSNIPSGVDEEYARSIIYNDGEMFGRFLEWLSKDYCIVPKSKVKENYQSLKNDIPDFKQDPKRHCGFLGGMTELELLFGTELFNEEME